MRTVHDEDGTRYLLLKRSAESSLVRNPDTGEEQYLPNDQLEDGGSSALETAASGLPGVTRRLLTAVHDDRGLGLLVELDRRGGLPVRTLLADYDLCESDLHGLLGEFRAAGLIEETDVAGERGYRVTEEAIEALERLRE